MRLFTASAVLLPLALLGCNPDDGEDPIVDDTSTDDVDTPEEARIRVVHASPDAPAVDVWVVGLDEPLFTGASYGATTDYAEVAPGTYTVELRAAPSTADDAVAYTADLTVEEGQVVTAIAQGLLTSDDADSEFRITPALEDFETPMAGTARVRIIHASATAPTVAIDVGNDGTPEVSDFARWDDTGVSGVELPAGEAINIGIWAGDPLGRVTAFTTPELPDGGELFVIAAGLLEDLPREETGFSLLAVAPTGSIGFVKQDPVVYAMHASPDAPPVDIFAGGAELVDDLDFGEISAPIQVPPGSYTLDFHGTTAGSGEPMSDPATSQDTPTLEAGERYLVTASGFLAPEGTEPGFQLIAAAEAFDIDDPEARLVAVHASPDAPAVDIGTVADGTLTPIADYTNVPFGAVSAGDGVSLMTGSYDLGIALTGETTPLFTFSGIAVAKADRIFAVANGSVADGDFGLSLVDTASAEWSVIARVAPDE